MAFVEPEDIHVRYSTTDGSEGDSEAGNAAGSLGKYLSTTTIPMATLGNLLPNITAAQNEAGITLYRCYFVANVGAGTWDGVRVWITSKAEGGAAVAIGLDPAGVVAVDDSDPQAEEIPDQETEPAGVLFSAPDDFAGGLEAGTVGPEECFALWIRATVAPNTTATAADQVELRTRGTTEVS